MRAFLTSVLIRPERRLLMALCLLVIVLAGRAVDGQWRAQTAGAAREAAPPALEWGSEPALLALQDRLRRQPDSAALYAQLGHAYLQRFRETADAALYALAETAFDAALARQPDQVDAVIGQGVLALSRHQFQQALAWGQQAVALNPYRAQAYGVLVDAYVELGRYDEAESALQDMIDLRPDLNSYSRLSYLRELHGDLPGAITAMTLAVGAGAPGAEGTLWAQVQLGQLYFKAGDRERAAFVYRQALYSRPGYAYALAGLARIDAARGRYGRAIKQYQDLVTRLPLPEFAIALGELYQVRGRPGQAHAIYDLVRAMQRLNAAAGMDTDLELALFDAEHGDDTAQAVAQARAAYGRRPSIYAAATLAWALYWHGDYVSARQYMDEALRLGTQDAMLFYQAGRIAYALDDAAAAQRYLEQALALNPRFSILHAPQARALLREMTGE